MENYKVREHITLKTAHIVGQYYRFLKKTNILTDAQIFHTIFLIILLPHYEFKKRLFEEVKTWYDLASKNEYVFKDKTLMFYYSENESEIKNNSFLFTITIQVIVKLLNKTKVVDSFLFLNYLNEKEKGKLIYKNLQDGMMGINNEYSLTQNKIKENIINFFSVKTYAIEVFEIKDLIDFSIDKPINYKEDSNKPILINDLDNFVDHGTKEELKEKYQICALCNGSIHNTYSDKYNYLNYTNDDKTYYRKTDLFATDIEENFKNNHFICIDCIIERFAPIQLLIDDGLMTEENVKSLDKNNLAYQLDEIIIRSNITKYMPLNFEERKRIILNEN